MTDEIFSAETPELPDAADWIAFDADDGRHESLDGYADLFDALGV